MIIWKYRHLTIRRNNENIILIFSLITLLYGCASIEPLQEEWTGRNLNDLIVAWGTPANTSDLSDGRRVVRYSSSSLYAGNRYFRYSSTISLGTFCNIDVFVESDNTIARMDFDGSGLGYMRQCILADRDFILP